MKLWGSSDCGKLREKNEDDYLITGDFPELFAVADGMGGHQAGEVASATAIALIEEYDFDFEADLVRQLKELIDYINQEIIARGNKNPEYRGMGTTLTMGIKTGGKICYGHVGDSRFYLFRDGKLRKVTRDHSLVEKMVEEGKITPEEAFQHPRSNVLTQALGLEQKLEIDSNCFEISEGDLVLLCTDGLTDMLRESEIEKLILSEYPDPEKITKSLTAEALASGGSDNITIVTGIIDSNGSDCGA